MKDGEFSNASLSVIAVASTERGLRGASTPRTVRSFRSISARDRRVRLLRFEAGVAEAVHNGVAAVAAEILRSHFDARRRLSALAFRRIKHALDPARNVGNVAYPSPSRGSRAGWGLRQARSTANRLRSASAQ